MKKRIVAVLAVALFTAIPALAQSVPKHLGGTMILKYTGGSPDCDQIGLVGTVTGSIGKGTATFGCHDNTDYFPLQPYNDSIDPRALGCAPILTTMSVVTDKFPDGIEFNVSATGCDGNPDAKRRFPEKLVGGFTQVSGGVPNFQYWGTLSGRAGRDQTTIIKFDGPLDDY